MNQQANIQPLHSTNETEEVILNQSEFESPFIEANTQKMELAEIAQHHIIPVFIKDNEPLISQPEFIDRTIGIAHIFLKEKQ